MSAHEQPAIDENRLNSFLGQMLGDMGAALNAALVAVGDRLGALLGDHPDMARHLVLRG